VPKKTPEKTPGAKKKNPGYKNLKTADPWKPGESGNPAGRPKGARNYATIMEEIGALRIKTPKRLAFPVEGGLVDAKTAVIMRAFSKAIAGNVAAMQMIMDRVDGKPINSIRAVATNDTPDWILAMAPKPISDDEVMNADQDEDE